MFIPCWSPLLFVFANPNVEWLGHSAHSGGQQIPLGNYTKDASPGFVQCTAARNTVSADLEPAGAVLTQLRGGGGGLKKGKQAGERHLFPHFMMGAKR